MNTAITPASDTEAPSSIVLASGRLRLEYLDGLRGLAALYVVMHHLAIDLQDEGLPHWIQSCLGVFRYGHFAVDLFIVLSGYSLMLPVARDRSGVLRGGVVGYLQRRTKRILPPYYAALIGSLLLLALTQGLPRTPLGDFSGYTFLEAPSLLSHLFLVHNLDPDWLGRIDSPLWSVATEWQIYFLFPLVLLPLYRRLGVASAVIGAFLLGLLPHWLFHGYEDKACFWFLGLFALGMMAATLSDPSSRLPNIKPVFYGIASVLCFAAVKVMLVRHGTWLGDSSNGWPRLDPLVGLGAAAILTGLAKVQFDHHSNAAIRLLCSPPLALLGAFSYSLYLTHAPILIAVHRLLLGTRLPAQTDCYILLIAIVPVCLVLAYLFHLAFERPFMPGHPKTERQAEAAAIVSPAP